MNASLSAENLHCAPITEFLLDAACLESRVIRETISAFGDSTLSEYLDNAVRVVNDPFQRRDDVIDAVYEYVAPLLGETVAKRVCGELEVCPVALTTNHHGVDFFAQSVQGSLIFSMRTVNGGRARTVPVFACGGIPLDNLTYPQGLLLYHVGRGKLDSMPRKLPIFSNRLRRQTASLVEPIQEEMIERARRRVSKMVDEREISSSLLGTLQRILNDDYASPAVSRLSTYSEQAVVLNHRIWKRLFADPGCASDLIYLELEKLTGTLLQSDLLNSDSLFSCAVLDSKCRQEAIEVLDGISACWQRSKLMDRVGGHLGDRKVSALKDCGTMFFWGVNDQHRKIPLCLVKGAEGEMLRGIDNKGRQFEYPFEPEALAQGLREKKLLPSLFTCFLTLSLARGVTCLGGYYQAEYLPAIQHRLSRALRSSGYGDVASCVDRVHTKGYLGGMQAVGFQLEQGRMGPAGPVEISASGGLGAGDFERIQTCTVRDAHIASLFETIPDLRLGHVGPPNWKSELALECDRQLSGRVVCRSVGVSGGVHSGGDLLRVGEARDRPVS